MCENCRSSRLCLKNQVNRFPHDVSIKMAIIPFIVPMSHVGNLLERRVGGRQSTKIYVRNAFRSPRTNLKCKPYQSHLEIGLIQAGIDVPRRRMSFSGQIAENDHTFRASCMLVRHTVAFPLAVCSRRRLLRLCVS